MLLGVLEDEGYIPVLESKGSRNGSAFPISACPVVDES